MEVQVKSGILQIILLALGLALLCNSERTPAAAAQPKKGNKKIFFKDSLLILPSSLDKLGKSFNAGNKVEFDFETFNRASLTDPKVRDSVLEYNFSDCVLLYNIINSFSSLMWDLFRVNIHLLASRSWLRLSFRVASAHPEGARERS